jgi:phosphoglycerol transferase
MIDNIKVNYKKEIQYCLLAGFIVFLAVYFFLGLKNVDLNVPFRYEGDAFGCLTAAQNFITGNGRYLYTNMGAPGVVSIANWPDSSNIHYFGMWILSLFIKEPGLLINIFYILTYIFISISATISLRLLNITPMTSILGGVLYSLLPYHFYRGENHLFLSVYTIVPFACVLILWIINGEICFNKIKPTSDKFYKNIFSVFNYKINISIIIAIFIGMDLSYYIFFSCLGISFAIIWNFLQERNFRKTFSSAVILLTVIISTLVNLIPYIITIFNGIESGIAGTRDSHGVEFFSLKISQLVLPVPNHRIHFFFRIRRYYDDKILNNPNENYMSSLGLLISAGLIISFLIGMMRFRNTGKNRPVEAGIQHSAVLNVFMVILGITGGISSLIAFIIPSIRCYNRLSIYIAFYSLYIVVYYLNYFLLKLKTRNISKMVIIAVIGILSALDMVSASNAVKGREREEQYYTHKEFVKKIEDVTPAGSMIFQLPFVPSDHHTGFGNMGKYQQFFPFIHSNSLRWSYRAQQGSEIEKWQNRIGCMPVESMLKHLAGTGFMGLYIDTFGYTNAEYNNLKYDILTTTGVKPIISKDGRMVYFYLEKYFEDLKKTFDKYDKMIYENISTVIFDNNQIFQASNSFGGTLISGWSYLEKWGCWSDGHTAKIKFSLSEKKEVYINMNFSIHPNPAYFTIDINGIRTGEYTFNSAIKDGGAYKIAIPIKIDYLEGKNGVFPVVVQFNIKNPAKSEENQDDRMMAIGLASFYLNSED